MNAIETLRSHRPEVGDYEAEFDAALAKLETLLQAAEGMAAWEYEQQHASGAEMLLSLRLRIERVAAAVRDAKGDTM